MSLEDVLACVRERERTLTVRTSDEAAVSAVRERFADRNLTVEHASLPAEGSGRVDLMDGEKVRASAPLAALEPSVAEADDPPRAGDSPYAPLLEHVDDATFALDDPRQRRHAIDEVADRAWRHREGRLVAGFPSAAAFDARRDAHLRLGKAVDLHVYLPEPTRRSDSLDGVTVHPFETEATLDYRLVAYDGGDDETQRSAFLAEESGAGAGVLTYDPGLVDAVFDSLGVPSRAPP